MNVSIFMVISIIAASFTSAIAVIDPDQRPGGMHATALGICWFVAETQLANTTCGVLK
jgi:hypothetical protein